MEAFSDLRYETKKTQKLEKDALSKEKLQGYLNKGIRINSPEEYAKLVSLFQKYTIIDLSQATFDKIHTDKNTSPFALRKANMLDGFVTVYASNPWGTIDDDTLMSPG